MNTTVAPLASPGATPSRPSSPAAGAAPPQPAAAADRVAAAQAAAPLLTAGAVILTQLVPGVVEAEGAGAIATAVGIGLRAAMTNPVVGFAAGSAGFAAGGYVKSLVHDAFASQPALKPFADAATSLDASVRTGLGLPPSSGN